MRIILLNGPPRSGKDTAAGIIQGIWNRGNNYGTCEVVGFAEELKERTHALYKLVDDGGRPLRHDHLEEVKDAALDTLEGLTPRQAYIAVATLLREHNGKDILGRWLHRRLAARSRHESSLGQIKCLAVPDAGFVEECQYMASQYGSSSISLVRMHRPGCDFSKDSRSYLTFSGIYTIDVMNDSTVGDLTDRLSAALPWLD